MLGSTADTYFASVCARIQRNAWFDSGYIFCVSVRTYSAQCLVRQWIHGLRHFGHSSEPLVSDSHLLGVRRWSTGLWTFLEDDFRMDSVSSSCWFNTGYMPTLRFRLQKTAEIPQLQFFKVVDISFMVQRHISMVLATINSPVGVLERGDRCPWYAGRAGFSRCPLCATTGALVTFAAHQQGRLHPVVAQRLIPMVLFVQKIIEILQLLVDAVADVPVVRSYRFSRAGCGCGSRPSTVPARCENRCVC